jgi:hypothetical protein
MVGTVDGTHLGLALKPSLHGEEYFTRKSRYAVVAMVVNNDKRRIRYLNIGWPASVHDERVWSNTTIARNPDHFFSPGEYILGNSAFSNRTYLVPAFKQLGSQMQLQNKQAKFNVLHSGSRVRSEHTISIWKGRFPWLRSISIRITNKHSMKRLIHYVTAMVILNNFFVLHTPPESWIEPEDRDDQFLNELHYISSTLNEVAGERGVRREQVLNYLREIINL